MTINLKKWDSNVNETPAKYLILFLSGILVIQAICGINKRNGTLIVYFHL